MPARPPTMPETTMNPQPGQQAPAPMLEPYIPDMGPRGPAQWGTNDDVLNSALGFPGVDPNPRMPRMRNIPGIVQGVGGMLARFGSANVGRMSAGMMNNWAAAVQGYVKGLTLRHQLAREQFQDSLDQTILTQRMELLHAGEIFSTYDKTDPRRIQELKVLAAQNGDHYLLSALDKGEDEAERVLTWRDNWLQTLMKTSNQTKKAAEDNDYSSLGGAGGGAGAEGSGSIASLLQGQQGATNVAQGSQIGPDGQFITKPGQPNLAAGAPATGGGTGTAPGVAPGGGTGTASAAEPSAAQPQTSFTAPGGGKAQQIGQPGVPVDPTGTHPALQAPAGGVANYNTPIMNQAQQYGINLDALEAAAETKALDPSASLSGQSKGSQRLIQGRANEIQAQLTAVMRSNLGGQQVLNAVNGISPQLAQRIYGYVEGLEQPPGTWSQAKPVFGLEMALARKVDPSFNQSTYATRAKSLADFTSGKDAHALRSFATAYDHTKRFLQELKKRPSRGPFAWISTYLPGGSGEAQALKAQLTPLLIQIVSAYEGGGHAPVTEVEKLRQELDLNTVNVNSIKVGVSSLLPYLKDSVGELQKQAEIGTGWSQEQLMRRFDEITHDYDTSSRVNEITGAQGRMNGRDRFSSFTFTPE
jgi:hypothetical protein